MDEKKMELVHKATEVYMKYGIKSVTMDEMARQLGVSKKTLYLHVKDKNDLVEQCLLLSHEAEHAQIDKIIEDTENAIEQMMLISKFILDIFQKIHPSIFFDIAKYHPSAMEMMNCHKQEYVCGSIEKNIEIGIKQGLYRKNIHPKVISQVWITLIDTVMNGEGIPGTDLKPYEIYSELFRYHIRGIASEIGLEYLVELVKNDESLSHGI
jgi:AcrR family transcriptional regulator